MRKRSVDRSGNYAVLLISLLVALIASPLIGSVSAGPVASVSIDQSEPISVDADSQYQFSATLYDSQGGVVSGTIGWWVSNGSIDAAGLFTPWTAGVVTIVASSNGFNDSLNISVTPGWPITLDLQVESSTVPIDGSVQLKIGRAHV